MHKDIPEFYQLNSLSSSRPRDLDPLCFGDDIYSYFIYERSQVLIWVPIFNFNTIPETRFPNKGDILESWTTPRQAVKQNPGGENVEISRKKKNARLPTSSDNEKGSRAGSAGGGGDGPTRPASGLKVKRAPPGRGVGGGTTSGGRPPSDLKPIWRLLDCLRRTGPEPAVRRRKRGHRGTRGTSPIQSQTYQNKRRSER